MCCLCLCDCVYVSGFFCLVSVVYFCVVFELRVFVWCVREFVGVSCVCCVYCCYSVSVWCMCGVCVCVFVYFNFCLCVLWAFVIFVFACLCGVCVLWCVFG